MTARYVAMAAGIVGLAVAAPAAAQDYLSANLLGEGSVKDASADFNAEADLSGGELCYYLEAEGLSGITGASINKGGKDGAPVVTLQVGDRGSDEVCSEVAVDVLTAMTKKPAAYTIVIYTEDAPEGALSAKLKD